MKLGFVSAILPDLNLQQVVSFAAQQQFDCVEVMCWPSGKAERKYAGITHIDVTHLTQTQADDINALFSSHDVAISGLGYYPNPLDPDPAVSQVAVEHIKKVITATRLLGLKNMNTFVGRDWTRTIDDNWPRFLQTWKPLIAFAEENDVKVGIENCPMSFGKDEWPGGKNLAVSPKIWRRMFSDIPSNHFGLNYDPSHFVLQQMDPLSCLREFKEKLFHIHAKDMTIPQDRLNDVGIFAMPKEWHIPRIPGFGMVNWTALIATLHEIGFKGSVCIEVEDESFGTHLEGRQQALKVARNVLRPFIA